MADKDLFNGHKYTFTKISSSLVLEDATDNSHEKVTFRRGLVASQSIDIEIPGTDAWGIDLSNINGTGSSNGDKGISIRCGDNVGGTRIAYFIQMFCGTNTSDVGLIYSWQDAIYYTNFTGVHKCALLESDSVSADLIPTGSEEVYNVYKEGTIVSLVKSEIGMLSDGKSSGQPLEYCVTSSIHQDKRVFGVYMNSQILSGAGTNNHHFISSVGDGVILVNSQNGNIENGDYITTASGSGGYGCKQNSEFLANYTVAKSLTDVDWSTEPSSSKLIACTYHCG